VALGKGHARVPPVRGQGVPRTGRGQVVPFPELTFSGLGFGILGDTIGSRPKLAGVSAVGFAEVALGGIRLEELMRPPVDVVDAAGDDLIDHRLSYVLQRQRTNPAEPVRVDEEPAMHRLLAVPGEREFELSGDARISAQAPDPLVDRILGLPGSARGRLTAPPSAPLAGPPEATPAVAASAADVAQLRQRFEKALLPLLKSTEAQAEKTSAAVLADVLADFVRRAPGRLGQAGWGATLLTALPDVCRTGRRTRALAGP